MDKIAIIIINYNTQDETTNCLKSLKKIKTKNFDYKVFVIDNGSTDKFFLAGDLDQDKYEIIRSEKNLGFCGGNNLGAEYALVNYNPDYLLFLNSDTLVHPDFLSSLYCDLNQHSDNALAVSKIYFAKGYEFWKNSYKKQDLGKIIWYAGGVIDWENLFTFHFGIDEVDRGQFDKNHNTEFATGCSFLIKREIVEDFGLFDENYFLYYEDVDFSERLKKNGYKLVFSPQSLVYHLNGGSSDGSGGKVQVYYQTRNRLFFFFKYGNLKIKLRVIKLALKFLLFGNSTEKQAVIHFFIRKFGKNNFIK